jgi:tetratricopeptide (TPR) repeat protein
VRGMYNYFVDLAPSFVHIFRFLMFLPAGNRAGGLTDIEYAAAHGTLFGRMAQLQLVPIYGALEGRPAEAIALGERLERALPANDEAAFALADVYSSPAVESRDQAGRVYQEVIDRHRTDDTSDGVTARARALYGVAGARFDAWRCDEALGILSRTIDAPGAAPDWVLPRFLLRRSGYRLLLNDRQAGDDAQRVLNDPAMARWHDDARDVLKRVAEYQSRADPALYAALVPANRLVVEGQYAEARERYEALARGHMDEPQVRYRLAYLDFAQGLDAQARPTFEALATTRGAPDWVRASSWLYVGRIDDLSGRRAAAMRAYQKVVDDYSNERASLAAQVGVITPYQRPPR